MKKAGEEHLKVKSKKRRLFPVPETDSSDDCDSPSVKTRRHQRINKLSSLKKKTIENKDDGAEATCSYQNVGTEQFEKDTEQKINDKIPTSDIATELSRTEENLNPLESLKSQEKILDDKNVAASSKSDVKDNLNDCESSDKCPICWAPFTNQEVAIPSSCNHCFCVQCIIEWSKNTNTCPVDRQTYHKIEIRQKFGEKVTRYMPIAMRNLEQFNIQDLSSDSYSDSDISWNGELHTPTYINHIIHSAMFASYNTGLMLGLGHGFTDEEEEEEEEDDTEDEEENSSNNYNEEESIHILSTDDDEADSRNSSLNHENEESLLAAETDSSIADHNNSSPYYNFSSVIQDSEEQSSPISFLSTFFDNRYDSSNSLDLYETSSISYISPSSSDYSSTSMSTSDS